MLFLASACERTELSPVEIKIDDSYGAQTDGIALAARTSADTYTVSGNETIFSVANKYNVDPMNLARINGINPPYKLRPRQVLRLPTEPGEPTVESSVVAIDPVAKNIEKDSPETPAKNNGEKKRKEQLDAEFAELVTSSGKGASAASAKKAKKNTSATGADSNKQENTLSSPKITKTASGSDIAKKPKEAENVAKEAAVVTKSGGMSYPVNGKIISRFGDVKDGIANDGINIKSSAGTPVKASADGTVLYAGNKLEEEFGNVVIVQHKNDLITSYAHLGDIAVKKDAKIKAGDVLGTVGSSGDVTEPQLHFEIMKDKIPVNPMKYLPKEAGLGR
ncbi:MAG: M23 family metallopeptidase [Holosporaceae bacterium]|jgi:murein DD-endopeptidase MepM/ murein hydrolase activator NlpD|nr:M23 family metallopeptidase [Holosporaceae bacterium]